MLGSGIPFRGIPSVVTAALDAAIVLLGGAFAAAAGGLVAPGAGLLPFFAAGAAAALVVIAADPLRGKIRRRVDRKFSRIAYEFREAQRRFIDDVRSAADPARLAARFMAHTGELLQTERCGFFVLAPGNRLRLVAHLNFGLLEARGVAFDASELRSPLRLPVARRRCVEPGTEVEPADEEVFRRWGIAVAVGMQARDGEIIGFLVCGPKRSGLRYTAEDLDLLGAAGIQAGLAIERLRLSERLAREHAEAARLERLSTLKSYVVSSVSHDLRTPLTSIKMFAELLRTRESLPAGAAGEYLEIIEGETDRLTRIVTQVLDAASLERGAMEFHPRPVDLNASVRNALRTMAYELRAGRCACETSLAPGTLMIEADEDAVARALVNVIANAVRYAGAEKRVSIATVVRSGAAAVEVHDNGIGIGEAEAPRVFEPFYRGGAARMCAAEGAGLGLTIVRQIVDADGGSVGIAAAPGGGTVVTLCFPRGPIGPTGDADGQSARH